MRKQFGKKVEKCRVTKGDMASSRGQHNGQFVIWHGNRELLCQVSDGSGWDRVSVSILSTRRGGKSAKRRSLPSWEDMNYIKELFWDDDEAVFQIHPPRSEYVDNFQTLHLWKPQNQDIKLPDKELVGIPGLKQDGLRVVGVKKAKWS